MTKTVFINLVFLLPLLTIVSTQYGTSHYSENPQQYRLQREDISNSGAGGGGGGYYRGGGGREEEDYSKTPPPPRILSHKQAQNHDGTFKFAYAAENGLAHTEAISPDGSRNGGYTYVDPHGKTISVKYSAGKEGFRILQADHVPHEIQAASHGVDTGIAGPPGGGHGGSPQYRPAPPPRPHYSGGGGGGATAYSGGFSGRQLVSSGGPPAIGHYPIPRSGGGEDDGSYKPHLYESQGPRGGVPLLSLAHGPGPKPLYAQPKHYGPPLGAPENSDSNSVENEKLSYPDVDPGKPYSFGDGYSFAFNS